MKPQSSWKFVTGLVTEVTVPPPGGFSLKDKAPKSSFALVCLDWLTEQLGGTVAHGSLEKAAASASTASQTDAPAKSTPSAATAAALAAKIASASTALTTRIAATTPREKAKPKPPSRRDVPASRPGSGVMPIMDDAPALSAELVGSMPKDVLRRTLAGCTLNEAFEMIRDVEESARGELLDLLGDENGPARIAIEYRLANEGTKSKTAPPQKPAAAPRVTPKYLPRPNLNTLAEGKLAELPHVGADLAKKICEVRAAAPFVSLADLCDRLPEHVDAAKAVELSRVCAVEPIRARFATLAPRWSRRQASLTSGPTRP